jgi:xanthine dehydrogenase YagS FAD-binding subunit
LGLSLSAAGVLKGSVIDERTAVEAGKAAMAEATPLSKNAYKVPIFETLVKRAVLATVS